MGKSALIILLLFPLFLVGGESYRLEDTFSEGNRGWTGDFADYPVGSEAFYELSWGWETLPKNVDGLHKGLYLSGNNHSDDLFMYVKKEIDGLLPNTDYRVVLSVVIEDNIPPGQFGVGGSPGEGVAVKVGASTEEPIKIDRNGFYLMNIDKGDQQASGSNSVVVGTLANEAVDPEFPTFELIAYDNGKAPLRVRTDEKGRLWVFFGTDSGFEAVTKYYIVKIVVDVFD